MLVLLPRDLESTSPHEPMWSLVIAAFLQERGSRTGSRRTVETYARIVRRFLLTIADPASATPFDVHRFAHAPTQDARPPAPATILSRLAAVSGLYEFAVRMGVVAMNPAAGARRPRARQAAPRWLSTEEVARLLSVIPDTRSGLLDRAMILTAVLTGLRRTELVELRVTAPSDDVALYEVRTKGGVVRRRELPEPAWRAIVAAADAADRTVGGGELVFPVSDATLYAHLRCHATAAGLSGVSPHSLRHTAAQLRRRSGASIEDVCSLLGHHSIATTSTYLRDLEVERDDGWGGVASALGLIAPRTTDGSPRLHTSAGSQTRSRPVQLARRDGRANDHPAHRIGEHVHALLPRHQRTARGRRAGADF
jgi:integrase/recombinase XerD